MAAQGHPVTEDPVVFVEPGSVVKQVAWETVPDKYMPVKVFSDHEEATMYAEETYGYVWALATFPEGVVRLLADVAEGDVVQGVRYRLQPWRGITVPLEYDQLAEAKAAVPPGRTARVHQVLRIGAPGGDLRDVSGPSTEITGRRRFTVVRLGAVVQDVVWEAVPERYNPTKSFPVRAEAEAYARETYGTTHQLLTFPEGVVQVVRLGQDWPEHEVGPQAGDTVHEVKYRVDLDRLPDVYTDEPDVETGDLEAARAAVPAGRSAWIMQILSIGPRRLRVIGTADRVDSEGGVG